LDATGVNMTGLSANEGEITRERYSITRRLRKAMRGDGADSKGICSWRRVQTSSLSDDGLVDKFRSERIIDTPICEDSQCGDGSRSEPYGYRRFGHDVRGLYVILRRRDHAQAAVGG